MIRAFAFPRKHQPATGHPRVGQLRLSFRLIAVLALLLLLFPNPGHATTDGAALCERAAAQAARITGVPLDILRTITLVETGRRNNRNLRPWPWTVNLAGKGYWFGTRDEAMSFTDSALQQGVRSLDIGCFQLNYRWHGQAFGSAREMFDPFANALYAARFLQGLYREKGNWTEAAGAYHSRTPKFSARYMKRFTRIRAELGKAAPMPLPLAMTNDSPRPISTGNGYPLFVRNDSGAGTSGSLFPAGVGRGTPLLPGLKEAGPWF